MRPSRPRRCVAASGQRVILAGVPRLSDDELAKMFREHHRRSFLYALKIVRNEQDAEEAASRAWEKVCRGWPEDVRDPVGLLLYMVSQCCIEVLRSRTRRLAENNEVSDLPAESRGLDPADQLVLDDCLQKLSPEDLRLIWLSRADGVNDSEVARVLGRHRRTVPARAPAILATLRECVEGAAL